MSIVGPEDGEVAFTGPVEHAHPGGRPPHRHRLGLAESVLAPTPTDRRSTATPSTTRASTSSPAPCASRRGEGLRRVGGHAGDGPARRPAHVRQPHRRTGRHAQHVHAGPLRAVLPRPAGHVRRRPGTPGTNVDAMSRYATEPATDEPATDEPATDEPATDEPATDEPATGRARHGRARHGRARHGRARHGRARHGRARHGRARHGRARHGRAHHGLGVLAVQRSALRPPCSPGRAVRGPGHHGRPAAAAGGAPFRWITRVDGDPHGRSCGGESGRCQHGLTMRRRGRPVIGCRGCVPLPDRFSPLLFLFLLSGSGPCGPGTVGPPR